ncbi:hypothetical protein RUM44_000485 [Polyplax serrata]|uniref:ARID domain-containing protein n=1 Tax=Polyplax serrata TaxID=468196 RepID=A0ABR1B5Q5_POLSC
MLTDEPPYLSVGTEVSAKYKGAFCEAKVRKVDKTVKCKVSFKLGSGTYTVLDSSIKGTLRVGASVEAKHPEKKEFFEATITKIQDCSQYTVVFDDGDITTLRRSALCLKSGRHFAESETLDQLPLTHPEHFSNPVVGGGGRRGRRCLLRDDSSGDEDTTRKGKAKEEKEANIGKVVCVELGDKKKVKDNWFPGLVVSPNAQDTVQIRVKDEYLIRSFSDGRYYTVPKKEASEFTREIGIKVDNNTLKTAVEKALHFIDKDELPPHWDRELLFGLVESDVNTDSDDGLDSDSSDDEPREEKDHFVAQLYKFMDDRGTPINNCPSIGGKDLDLYKLFNVVHKLNGYNRVTNRNQWKNVSTKLGLGITTSIITQVKHAYKKYLHSFEDFYRKLGCTMVSHPRNNRARNKSGRSLIRDRDRATPSNPLKVKCDLNSSDNSKSNSKSDQVTEKDNTPDTKSKEEILDKKEDKKPKEEEPEKGTKGKNVKKEALEVDEVSESEDSVSVSEEAYSISRPTSSLRKKFPTLKASPVVVREKRKADGSPDGRKVKRTRMLKSRSSSGSDIKATSDGEDDSKGKETPYQRNTTRSRSKEDTKIKKDSEKDKKPKTVGNNSDTQKKTMPVKAKKNDNDEAHMQKKGRKRRNTDTGGKSPSAADEDLNLPCLPPYKNVFIGDILKIYYGAPGETKVIYEAKVVDIKENDSGETIYLVHYAGWNSRYDEWVKRNKIADNLNWTPARNKASSVTRQTSKSSSGQKRKTVAGKVESSGSLNTRATTPSSGPTSRNKSATTTPAQLGGKRVTRNTGELKLPKRTRRISGQTDVSLDSESDSDQGESVSDGEGSKKALPVNKEETLATTPTSKNACPKKIVRSTKKKVVKKSGDKTPDGSNEEETVKAKRTKKGGTPKEKEVKDEKFSNDDDADQKICDEPKGRDFDLNEIRSELKGIDKAVKVGTELATPEGTQDSAKVASDAFTKTPVVDERTVVTTAPPQPPPSPVSMPSKEEEKEPKVEEKATEKKDVNDDIYEFKEPEPFEYQEVLRPMNRIYDEGDRSPDKAMKKTTTLPEKKDVCKFEVDVKSRFRKTIGKKMKEVCSGSELKKESILKPDKPEALPKMDNFLTTHDYSTKTPEKEIPVLKMETDVQKSVSPEPVRIHSAVLEEQSASEKKPPGLKMEDSPEKESTVKSQLEVQSCKSPHASKLSPEPPNLTPVGNAVFSSSRSPLLNLINEERKPPDFKKSENSQEDEDDPISAAIQRVIAQSSMDDDSDEMELFTVTSSSAPAIVEEVTNLPKNTQPISEPKSEILVTKKMSSKRKSSGKRIMLSKEFVMDDSSSESDSDSAEERLVIVNEDESTNDSNRSQKTIAVATEEERKAVTPTAENRFKKTEEAKGPSTDSSVPKKFHPGDSASSKKSSGLSKVVEDEWKQQKHDKPSEEEGENNLRSLLCEETIPGSPAPPTENKELAEPKVNVLELQFASGSQPVALPPPPPLNGAKRDGNDAAVVMDNTPPTTPESNLSSMSGSPRDDRVGSSSLDNESSKSLRDSSEVDVDNDPNQRVKNLDFPKKPDKDPESPSKKKWHNRKRSESLSEVTKRIRQPVGRPPKTKDLGSDSDDTSENSQTGTHNVNTESLLNSRSQKPSKYNFFCELDPELDATQRIALLEQKLQECRKTYMNVKSKLASIDRRRKKLRRREREALKVSKMLERMTDQ